jgi:hypothetical protein
MESIGGMCLAMCYVGCCQSFIHAIGLGADLAWTLLTTLFRFDRTAYKEALEDLQKSGIGKPVIDALNFFESNRVTIETSGRYCDGCNVSSRSFTYHSFFVVEGGQEGRRWRRFVKYSVPVNVSFREAGAYYTLAHATSRGTIVSVSKNNFGRANPSNCGLFLSFKGVD